MVLRILAKNTIQMNTEVISTTNEKMIDKLNLMLYFFCSNLNFIILFLFKNLEACRNWATNKIQEAFKPFGDSNI